MDGDDEAELPDARSSSEPVLFIPAGEEESPSGEE